MKKTIFIFFAWMTPFIFICCGTNEKDRDSLLIQEVDGITHLVNPGISKNPPREFYLEEELSIVNHDDGNFILGVISDIDIDADGNIYILDWRYCCIHIFNSEGRYLRPIGKKGQGPGEFLFPLDLILSDQDRLIHVLDYKNNKISRYHLDGVFDVDMKFNEGSAQRFFMSGRFYFVLFSFYDDQGLRKNRVVKYNYDGKVLLQSGEFIADKEKPIKKNNYTITGGMPYGGGRYFAFNSINKIYTGFSDQYEISIFDLDFNLAKVIQKRNPTRIKVTQEEKDDSINYFRERQKKKGRPVSNHLLKLIQFPQYHALFKGMWIDNRNRLLVRTPSRDGKVHIDIFTDDGVYIDEMLICESPGDISIEKVFRTGTIFRGDYIYTWIRDINDECEFKKYRIIEKN